MKQMLSSDACSGVSGGESLVFTLPGRGALAITTKAQQFSLTPAASPGARIL